jgi:hypothetical protein
MTWEEKTQMIRLHNSDKMDEFYKFVTPFLESEMDAQAQEMLMDCLELTKETITENIDFFEKIAQKFSSDDMSFRPALRVEYLKLTLEEIKKEKE